MQKYYCINNIFNTNGLILAQDLRYQLLREQVALAVHESFLEIISSPTKGRGLRTNKEFFKDQFVVEYRGGYCDKWNT
jgi:hypothetical protein